MRDRFTTFLRSTSNIAGSLLALAVIGCYLLGWIDAYWGWLTLGAYAAGYLAFAFTAAPATRPSSASTEETLQWLRQTALPKLPNEARPILADILTRVEGLMPRLKEMETQGLVEAPSRAHLKQTVTKLLPDAIDTFLRLPPDYAKTTVLANGKTAQHLLSEQLGMLQTHIQDLEDHLLSADINAMLANGRFLQEKFQTSILNVDD